MPRIKSWNEVESTLSHMAELRHKLDKAAIDLRAKEAALQAQHEKKTEATTKELFDYEEQVKAFALAHEADFKDSRTKKFPAGSVSLRQSTRLDIPNPKETIELLKAAGREDAIKCTESIDKAVLRKIPEDAELARFLVTRVVGVSATVSPPGQAK